ncbi:hypothetical protein LIER_04877 [Lithospermum erythrorhizon]|uniref:Uncharacterized protein n=1 Tax=Lithospermum erythrorhizon TaxID=34254 RepID=A0AAV3NYD4_LITER
MDEQGISSIFADRLNPSLCDRRVYVRECSYAKVASHVPRLESLATHPNDVSSDDESSLFANSPIPQVTVENKVVSKITQTNDDVKAYDPIKDKMSQSSENQMDNYELRPRNDPKHTECSRAGEMSLLPVGEKIPQESALPVT